MVRRIVKIGAVIAVVILVAVFLLPSFGMPPGEDQNLSTDVLVGTPDGERLIYVEDPFFPWWPVPATVVKLSDTTISYIRWKTDYQALSDDYTQYNLIAPSSVSVELFRIVTTTEKVSCGFLVQVIEDIVAVSVTQYDVGVWYSVGADFMGRAPPEDHTAKVLASEIIDLAQSGCDRSFGTFILQYVIVITVKAVGEPPTPKFRVAGLYDTTINLDIGKITGSESTTKSSG